VTNRELTVFDVLPHVGAGLVRLGMSRSEVRVLLGDPVSSYQKVPGKPFTDAYFGGGLQVAFDGEDRGEYIELNGPGAVDAVFYGRSLLFLPADDVLEWMSRFAEYDHGDPELGYSYVYPALDLSLWRPTLPETPEDEDGRFFRSIGIGIAGYYAGLASREIKGG
jgi:hypothetical protein